MFTACILRAAFTEAKVEPVQDDEEEEVFFGNLTTKECNRICTRIKLATSAPSHAVTAETQTSVFSSTTPTGDVNIRLDIGVNEPSSAEEIKLDETHPPVDAVPLAAVEPQRPAVGEELAVSMMCFFLLCPT